MYLETPFHKEKRMYREARARLFRAFCAILIILGMYLWVYVQIVYAEGIPPATLSS